MVEASAGVSQISYQQPSIKGLDAAASPEGVFQCRHCPRQFPCHQPYVFHLQKHGDAPERIYIEYKQPPALRLDIRAIHRVWCDRGIHCVHVTISQPFGPTTTIREVDEEVIYTTEEFLQEDFDSSEIHKDAVKRIEELDAKCCRPIQGIIMSSPETFVKRLRSYIFACIPTLRKSKSSRQSSTSNPKPTSLYPSTEGISTKNGYDSVANDSTSTTNTVLPEDITAIIAVESFYSTSEGVRGHGVLVATRSDTIILLQRVDLGALQLHVRVVNQLRYIVGEHTYEELLKFEEKRMEVPFPVYSGTLSDSLPIEVGKELPLDECCPMLQAQVHNFLSM